MRGAHRQGCALQCREEAGARGRITPASAPRLATTALRNASRPASLATRTAFTTRVCLPCTALLSRKQQTADTPPLLLTPRHAAQVGTYFSTKVWSFTMRHHCGCKITITTDPKNAEYLVTDGARRKIETYDPDDAQVRVGGGRLGSGPGQRLSSCCSSPAVHPVCPVQSCSQVLC